MPYAGSVAGSRVTALRPMLRKWSDLVVEYRRRQTDDAPYWFGERASLSLLNPAVWLTGGIALEEYAAFKGKDNLAHGRADFWLKVDGLTASIEAKQCWPTVVGDGLSAVECAQQSLRSACVDVSRVDKREAPTRVGVAFIVASLPPSKVDAFAPEPFVSRLLRDVSYDFAAWAFYDRDNWPRNEKRRTFPGVVMLGRIARTRSR